MSILSYILAPQIRVRKECFGLLFYNARSTNLTFIESGNLIDPDLLNKRTSLEEFLGDNSENHTKIKRLLQDLTNRGILCESEQDY